MFLACLAKVQSHNDPLSIRQYRENGSGGPTCAGVSQDVSRRQCDADFSQQCGKVFKASIRASGTAVILNKGRGAGACVRSSTCPGVSVSGYVADRIRTHRLGTESGLRGKRTCYIPYPASCSACASRPECPARGSAPYLYTSFNTEV